MSTNNSRGTLTPEQRKACNDAIHSYIAKATSQYGRGAVILLPEFEEVNDEWVPVQGSGIRPTSQNSAFMRFGKMTISAQGKIQYLYTNHFGDSEENLANLMLFIDPTATVGSAVKGVRLVVHESVTPFSRTNPERDIKWADQENGLSCMKADDNGELKPIYRRTKVFFADDEGNYPQNAVNQLVEHDNKEQLSTAAFTKFTAANTQRLKNAARIAELKAKGTLSAKEKAELTK